MFTLEILRKVREGTLRAHEQRDLQAAAPLMHEYVKHDQLDVTIALLEEHLRQARQQGPAAERDMYWDVLYKIQSNLPRNSGQTTQWLLSQYETPRFPAHTKREIDSRGKKISAWREHKVGPLPLSRHSPDSYFRGVYGIMQAAVLKLDDATALRAAQLIKDKYSQNIRQEIASSTVKQAGTLFGIKGDTFRLAGRNNGPAITLPYLKAVMRLADKIDKTFERRGSGIEFIKATFIQALSGNGSPEVNAYILKQADRLSVADKKDIVLRYSSIHGGGSNKSICRTLDGRYHTDIQHTADIPLFDSYVSLLEKWSARHKSTDFKTLYFGIKNQHLQHYDWQILRENGVFPSERITRHYEPELPWAEIRRRLEMIRTACARPDMKPFDFDTNDYLEKATIRAVTYGHARDLKDIFDYYDSLTPEQKAERNFTNGYLYGFPTHDMFSRISRDPATLNVLTERMPLTWWFDSEDYKGPRLIRLMTLPAHGDNIDRFHDNMASYISQGRPMTAQEVLKSYAVLFPFLEEKLPLMTQTQRQGLSEHITREGYYPPFTHTLTMIKSSGDSQAAAHWVKAIYQLHTPKEAREAVRRLGDIFVTQTFATRDITPLVGFFEAIRTHDPEVGAWQKILAATNYYRTSLVTACVTQALATETLDLEGDASEKKFLRLFLSRVSGKNTRLDELEKEIKRELGQPIRDYSWIDKNHNAQLSSELFPYLKKYDDMEQSHTCTEHQRKLATLFDTFRQVDTFIRRHAQPTAQPVHDLCLFDLPDTDTWDKQVWGNLAIRYGHPILRLLPLAPEIEAYMRDHIEPLNEERRRINRDKLGKTGSAIHGRTLSLERMSPTMIRTIAARVGYDRGHENRAIANFCINVGATKEAFNETLDLLASFKAMQASPQPESMPDVAIDGAMLGLDGYRMERVPRGDPLNLWVGKMVNCCNFLGGDGADMARAQFNEPRNALYIIRDRRDRPIAKLSGWLSDQGNVVFNAWERKSAEEDYLLVRFTTAAALQIFETAPKVQRVMLGTGPLNPKLLPFKMAANPETASREVGKTRDSEKQFAVAERTNIGTAYEILDWEIAANMQRGEQRIKLTWRELQQLGLD